MLDLRTLDPARQSADRRVALAIGYGALGGVTFAVVAGGGGGLALAAGVVAALGGLPWVFAFGGRWRLLDDAVAGVPFAWRGERMGVWATAPVAGALGALLVAAALGLPSGLALLACMAGAAGYTAAVAFVEARYERAILLDLTALELRFERIVDTRSQPEGGRGVGVRAADDDLEVQVRAGGRTGGPHPADDAPAATCAPGATASLTGVHSGCAGRSRGRA